LGGAALGDSLEESLTGGRLPTDELFVYEDALRKGRTVLILRVEDDLQEEKARQALLETGVESVDAAREQWWIGLRDAEEEQYTTQGGDFRADENLYRNGLKLLSIGIDAGGLTKTPWTRYANRMPQFAAHPRFVLAMSAGRSIGTN
jgi:hypothetical protein